VADEQKPDKAMAGMLKRKNVWPPASAGEECPDAATLAAYFDRSLSASEVSLCELHFSACSRCQEQLAALARSEPPSAAKPAADEKPAFSWLWDWRWMAPVGAAVVVFVFYVSFKTMNAPTGSMSGGEIVAKREAAAPAPAASKPEKPAEPAPAKSDAAADAVSSTKTLSADLQQKSRRELDELHRKNAATALEPAPVAQALKDKGARSAEVASGVVASRALLKPAEEEKQVAAAESRVIVAQPPTAVVSGAMQTETAKTENRAAETSRAQAVPSPDAAPSVQSIQKQGRAIGAADAKEPAAPAVAGAQAKKQAALKKESTSGQQDTASSRYALEAEPQSKAKLLNALGEIIVTSPNSKAIWRLGSAGQIEHSRDAGKSWETQTSPAQESFLSGSASSESICWVGGSNGVLLRTMDGGENWESIPSPTKRGIVNLKASDQLSVTLTAADGHTFETRDAGAHWRAR